MGLFTVSSKSFDLKKTEIKTFIAFFDIMGFKNIVENKELSDLVHDFSNFILGTQLAMSDGTLVEEMSGRHVPDLSEIKVNCLHISDSVIFWTNGDSMDDFNAIVNICSKFYRRSLGSFFPIRGCLTYGEASYTPFIINGGESKFHNSSFIGKGLIDAYVKGESVEYAGCLFDDSVVREVGDQIVNGLIEDRVLFNYKVPYKSGDRYSLVFTPFSSKITELTFHNIIRDIKRMFTALSNMDPDNLPDSVARKMNNSIDFVSHFRDPDKKLNPRPIKP